MNVEAAKIITEGFLKGAFDVFNAMLSRSFSCQPDAPQPFAGNLPEMYPVAFQGRIKNNLGAVAMLFTVADAVRIAGMVSKSGAGVKAALSPEDIVVLKQVAESALGGGVAHLMERFGRGVEQLENVEVVDRVSAGQLQQLLGPSPTVSTFSFSGPPDFSAKAAFLYSENVEPLVPGRLLAPPTAAPGLSQAEVSDILSGFQVAEAPPKAARTAAPQNLDMVLDIRLEATARLGRVEMALGDILNLGPGSIVEVGHLVDEPVELLIKDKVIARGDVVVVDEKFGLRITEIVSPRARIESLR